MARGTDPLRRDSIAILATNAAGALPAARSNSALRLADSLSQFNAEARQTMQNVATQRAEKARAEAKKAAIEASGAELADAVREGKIRKSQNPWFVEAYNREAAAIRANDLLQNLQVESATWDEKDDPSAFAGRWRAEVGSLMENFSGKDQVAGFSAAAVSSQVLQSNATRNAARIESERVDNLAALTSSALGQAYTESGGRLSANQIVATLAPTREQWFATGGDEEGYRKMVIGAVTTAAYEAGNPDLLDILKSRELLYGPSVNGDTPIVVPDEQPPISTVSQAQLPPARNAPGMVSAGNLPLGITQEARNADGSISTVRTISIGTDTGEVLIPTVVGGKVVSNEEAIAHYRETGENFGTFESPEAATAYAEKLHKAHARELTVTAPPQQGLALPVEGRITSPFGARSAPIAGASTNHGGVDIAAPNGTPILARATGRVISAKREGNSGNVVRVDYGNGVVASFSHMKDFAVKEGDIVTPGQSLGGVGSAGRSTGNHVHYVLRVNGKRVDPTKFSGEVGGSFEGVSPQGQPNPFPGADQPYTANAPELEGQGPPANVLASGPSLYSLPGVAQDIEHHRWRIQSQVEAKENERYQAVQRARRERGLEAMDKMWERFGTRGIMNGLVSREEQISFLESQGFSAPEIGEALEQAQRITGTSVTLRNAQIAARGQTDGTAVRVVDVATRAARDGWSQGLEDEITTMMMNGELPENDATRLIVNSISRSEQLQQQAEADEPPGTKVQNMTQLNQSVAGMALRVTRDLGRVAPNLNLPVDFAERIGESMKQNILIYLAEHPGDYTGAFNLSKRMQAAVLQRMIQRAQAQRSGN